MVKISNANIKYISMINLCICYLKSNNLVSYQINTQGWGCPWGLWPVWVHCHWQSLPAVLSLSVSHPQLRPEQRRHSRSGHQRWSRGMDSWWWTHPKTVWPEYQKILPNFLLIRTYWNHLSGNLITFLPPHLTKVLVTLLLATDTADAIHSDSVGGAGQDHARGGNIGPTVSHSKK